MKGRMLLRFEFVTEVEVADRGIKEVLGFCLVGFVEWRRWIVNYFILIVMISTSGYNTIGYDVRSVTHYWSKYGL